MPELYRRAISLECLYLRQLIDTSPENWTYPAIRLLARIFGGYLLGSRLSEARSLLSAGLSRSEIDSIIWLAANTAYNGLTDKRSSDNTSSFHALLRKHVVSEIQRILPKASIQLRTDTESSTYNPPNEDWWDFIIKTDNLDAWGKYLIYLHVYEEMSVREIADLCSYAKSSVHTDLQRIIELIKSE